MPLDGEAKPMPKGVQTTRSRKPKHARPKATPATWAGIAAEKQGPCIVCGHVPPNDLHHVVPRDRGGPDVAENIVPLCRRCHQLVEMRERHTCLLFVEALWHRGTVGPRGGVTDEYSFACEFAGEDWQERIYHIKFERAACVTALSS
jgi:hypothetical protein